MYTNELLENSISKISDVQLSSNQVSAIKVLVNTLDYNVYDAIADVSTIHAYKYILLSKSVSDILTECSINDTQSLIESYNMKASVARDIINQELLFSRRNS